MACHAAKGETASADRRDEKKPLMPESAAPLPYGECFEPALVLFGRNLSFYGRFLGGFFASLIFFAVCAPTGMSNAAVRLYKPYFTDVGQLNYANFLMQEKDYKTAAREYARVIEDFPESRFIAEAQFRMSEALYDAGLYRDAEDEFKLFLENFADSPFSSYAKARVEDLRTRKDMKKAKDVHAAALPDGRRIDGMKAAQVMFFAGRSYDDIGREMLRLKNEGIDTVIVRVFHNRGDRYYPVAAHGAPEGVYFRTGQSPVVDDILGRLTALAHRNGLRIFAWMTTRYADYGVEKDSDMACKGYDLSSRKIIPCKGLDLFNERAVRRLEAIYSDLADYDIDGILFQDDLFLRHNEGFGPHMEKLYARDHGVIDPESFYLRDGGAIHYTQAFWQWASWKNRRLLYVADRLRKAVKKKRPNARFAINLMYENLTNPACALAWLSQNLEVSFEAGFDYFSIMAYRRQMEEELGKKQADVRVLIDKMVRDAVRTVGDPHRVLIKLQAVDWKTGLPLSYGGVVSLGRHITTISDVSLAVVPYRADFPFAKLSGAGSDRRPGPAFNLFGDNSRPLAARLPYGGF